MKPERFPPSAKPTKPPIFVPEVKADGGLGDWPNPVEPNVGWEDFPKPEEGWVIPNAEGCSSFIVDSAGVTLIGASTEDSVTTFFMPGYNLAVPLMTYHPMSVPSLEYAYIIGGGGTSTFSPEVERWSYLFVAVRSRSKPKRMVSFVSLSNGRLGVNASSTLRLYHTSRDPST